MVIPPWFFSVYTLVIEIYEAWMCMMQLWIQEADVHAMDWILRALCLAVRMSCEVASIQFCWLVLRSSFTVKHKAELAYADLWADPSEVSMAHI